jgi:hypothetical protein
VLCEGREIKNFVVERCFGDAKCFAMGGDKVKERVFLYSSKTRNRTGHHSSSYSKLFPIRS